MTSRRRKRKHTSPTRRECPKQAKRIACARLLAYTSNVQLAVWYPEHLPKLTEPLLLVYGLREWKEADRNARHCLLNKPETESDDSDVTGQNTQPAFSIQVHLRGIKLLKFLNISERLIHPRRDAIGSGYFPHISCFASQPAYLVRVCCLSSPLFILEVNGRTTRTL